MGIKKVVTFGETMLRLSPPAGKRLIETYCFDSDFGGGESNVAISLVNFGMEAQFVTRLPNNDLGQACLRYLHKNGVGTDHVILGGDRMGIYFYEYGADQRGSKVLYDRADSAFATLQPVMIDWSAVFTNIDWFHFTGISPATSEGAAATCLSAVKAARQLGVPVSCDLNYRSKLWRWGKGAGEVMGELLPYANVAIGNEEDASQVFGISAPETDVLSGELNAERYLTVCKKLQERFPNLKSVALTLRGSHSASHNTWSGVLYQNNRFYTGPRFEITHIVDRVGGGDAFAAGLIFGMNAYPDPQQALDFAVSASCLKHTLLGDANLVTQQEVELLMRGDQSGRVVR